MESMIVTMPATTTVEHLCPFRGTGHMRPGDMMTGVRMEMTAEFQSTPESPASTQGPSLCRVGSAGTEHTEKGWIETDPVEAESMFPDQSEVMRNLSGSDGSSETL